MINYDEFSKVEIKAGKILSAEKVVGADKLLRLMVDFGETKEVVSESGDKSVIPAPRQIVSGIAMYYPDPAVMVGKVCMFVTNLEPRTIRGLESNGMLFALSTPDGSAFSLLEPNPSIPVGTKAK
jgi:tRNA-binding EMAP/Myf-like protein